MKQLIQSFPSQLHEALIIGQTHRFKAQPRSFTNVVLTGLGGSGIGGSIVQNFVFDKLRIPFIVNKDYFLPSFVGASTLVIVCSYSGNTEETLMAMQQARRAKATIVCITSGGKIAEIANKRKIDCLLLPAGMPPRACIGYSLVQVLYTLQYFGLLQHNFERDIKVSIKRLKADTKDIQRKARSLAQKLYRKLPIIYSGPAFEGVAVRFRQQLNENSKMLTWHHVIPEMNHNELVGWRDKDASKAVVIIRDETDFERVQYRMDINKKVIRKYTPNIIEITAQGKSYFEKVFYLIHLTDWVSVFLADLRGQNATEVKVIDYLKGTLAKK
jgi:glucose/mannose-6-phosphate isomerase